MTAGDALRRIAGLPALLPLTALVLRARTVRPAPMFFAREAARSTATSVYRARYGGVRVVIRHRTGDVVTLGEVFHERLYEPPAELAARLAKVTRALDLGANIGLFGAFAHARWPSVEVLAYEPDPANAALHERAITLNGLQARWRLVRAAAGASSGRVRFVSGEAALSHVAEPRADGRAAGGACGGAEEVIEVAVEDVLPKIAEAELVKMDIEGAEWAILEDARFRALPPEVIVLEYHPRFCPEPDSRAAAERALTRAGLDFHTIWHRADGHGMLWAWRQ